jgi:endonuclease III
MAKKLPKPKKPLRSAFARAKVINERLAEIYPDAHCALHHKNALELLVATILSAQCTDAMVNKVTPDLFKRCPSAKAYTEIDQEELEGMIRRTGFFRAKSKNIKAAATMIVDKFNGNVPSTLEELILLPGVARKTANVVMGECFETPGITVDTHVGRLSRRMGLTKDVDPVKVERELNALVPQNDWTLFSHRMIWHGRQICIARKPKCDVCPLADVCPKIGVEA